MKEKRLISLCLVFCAVFLFASCKADFVGNKIKTKDRYLLSFAVLNGTEKETLNLKKGEELFVKAEIPEGEVSLFVAPKGGKTLYRGTLVQNESFSLVCTESGTYSIEVTGKNAKGKLVFEKVKGNGMV
ncbi:MAG: hypothetical protein Q4D20_04225 [Clostridia bacterium]|nr:hypothetical protein [Clostridia bacterium]